MIVKACIFNLDGTLIDSINNNTDVMSGDSVRSKLFDGVSALLKTLNDNKVPIAVLSDKSYADTIAAVASYFTNIDFVAVVGARDSVPLKPDPKSALGIAKLMEVEPENVLYLGDTAIDMQTAINANMIPVGALWGFSTQDELEAHGAKFFVNHPPEVLYLLSLLNGSRISQSFRKESEIEGQELKRNSEKKNIIVIAGPTAVGKTKFSIEIARSFDGEIVSADSMQLYKYMNIGSAKPDNDELSQVRHHLIDEIDPKDPFSVAQYQKLAKAAIADIFARGKQPIISGGTGLYINSLVYDMDFSSPPASASPTQNSYRLELENLAQTEGNEAVHQRLAEKDPEAAERIHPNNLKRVIRALEVIENSDTRVKPFENSFIQTVDYDVELICLDRDRQSLYERINERVDSLVEQGLVDEVRSLLAKGLTADDISMKGIGYKEIIGHLNGEYDFSKAIFMVKQNTRNYAKRQLTWFRRYDNMKWFNLSEYESDEKAIEDIITWLREKR